MSNLVDKINIINKSPLPEPKPTGKINAGTNTSIKAYIIAISSNRVSQFGKSQLLTSIQNHKVYVKPYVVEATTPETIKHDIRVNFSDKQAKQLLLPTGAPRWTWPVTDEDNGYDLVTGLYRKAYRATHIDKVVATTISHLRLWQHCVEINEPIMILEHDAQFISHFAWTEKFGKLFTGGVLGLNDPRGATRKANVFYQKIHGRSNQIVSCPFVDEPNDPPLPQGLAGNSAYIIKPWAAKALINKTLEIGLWPNDAVMCNQFFPWLQVLTKPITQLQGLKSTTTT